MPYTEETGDRSSPREGSTHSQISYTSCLCHPYSGSVLSRGEKESKNEVARQRRAEGRKGTRTKRDQRVTEAGKVKREESLAGASTTLIR